jgi:hypothetical protein
MDGHCAISPADPEFEDLNAAINSAGQSPMRRQINYYGPVPMSSGSDAISRLSSGIC